jgi:hypothetical protein
MIATLSVAEIGRFTGACEVSTRHAATWMSLLDRSEPGSSAIRGGVHGTTVGSQPMTNIAFSVHLVGGGHVAVTYDGPDRADASQVIEHVVSTLAQDTGVVRCRVGEQLIVLFGRGVAAVEVA